MRHRLILLVSVLGLALGGATLPLTAAHAATGAFDTVDASIDGEVSGTFTSDAHRARVSVLRPDGTLYNTAAFTPTTGVPVAFRLYTLGLEPGTTADVVLRACDAAGNCVDTDRRSVTLADAGPVTVSATPAHASPIVAADHPQSSLRVTVGNTENRVGSLRMFVTWLDPDGYHVDYWDARAELPQPTSTYDAVFVPEHMSSGVHRLRLTVRWGVRADTVTTREFEVEVVNPAPRIVSFTQSAPTIYPTRDGYRDTMRFTMKSAVFDPADEVSLQIEDAAVGGIVRTLRPITSSAAGGYVFEWDGRHEEGGVIWAGPFRAVVTLRDSVARAPEDTEQLSVNVVLKHLESRVFRKTVSAAGSKVAQYVGRCSRLRSPSRHGWTGSLGLYSNTRCRDGATASTVRTTHRITLPAAAEYSNPVINVYGGSPRLNTSDMARLLVRTDAGTWEWLTEDQSRVQWYGGMASRDAIAKDRTVTWALRVRGGRHWDAKSFAVRVPYRVLVND